MNGGFTLKWNDRVKVWEIYTDKVVGLVRQDQTNRNLSVVFKTGMEFSLEDIKWIGKALEHQDLVRGHNFQFNRATIAGSNYEQRT